MSLPNAKAIVFILWLILYRGRRIPEVETNSSHGILYAKWFSGSNRLNHTKLLFFGTLFWHAIHMFPINEDISTPVIHCPCVFGKRKQLWLTYKQ